MFLLEKKGLRSFLRVITVFASLSQIEGLSLHLRCHVFKGSRWEDYDEVAWYKVIYGCRSFSALVSVTTYIFFFKKQNLKWSYWHVDQLRVVCAQNDTSRIRINSVYSRFTLIIKQHWYVSSWRNTFLGGPSCLPSWKQELALSCWYEKNRNNLPEMCELLFFLTAVPFKRDFSVCECN